MKIGIYNDNVLLAQILNELIAQYFSWERLKSDIFIFTNGDDLLATVEELDAVFLDLPLSQWNGILLGKTIKRKNVNCKVIFATDQLARFKECFQIRAFRVITKPFDSSEVEESLEALLNSMIGREPILLYDNYATRPIP